MKRRVTVILISLVSILAVFAVYFGFYGKENRDINIRSSAASGSATLTSQVEWELGTNLYTDTSSSPGSFMIDMTSQYVDFVSETQDDTTFIGDLGMVSRIVEYTFWDNMVDWEVHKSDDGLSWTLHAYAPGTGCTDGGDAHAGTFSARYIKVIRGTGAWCGDGNVIQMKVAPIAATHTTAPTQIEAPDTLASWDTFTPTQTTPENTKIEYQFRVSADASNWTNWTDKQELSGDSIDLSSLPTEDGEGNKYKYLQIKATLTSYDAAVSPQIDEYQIQYSYNDICSDVDHTEIKLSTEDESSYGQNRTLYLAPDQANSTLTLDSRAVDASGGLVTGVSFSYSSDSCVKLSDNQFRAPTEGNSCTITSTSSCSNTSTLTINVNSPEPDVSCSLGPITSVSIEPQTFSIAPSQNQNLKVVFKDQDKNSVDPKTIPGFQILPDYQKSFWNITKGGGLLSDEDKESYTVKFTAGATEGTFTDSISFSACNGSLKASATPIVTSTPPGPEPTPEPTPPPGPEPTPFDQLRVVLTPSEVYLANEEQTVFKAKAYDSENREVTAESTFEWSLVDERAGEIVSVDGASLTFKASSKQGFYPFALKVVAKRNKTSDFAHADIGVDAKTSIDVDWVLRPNFYQINTFVGEAVKVQFVPRVVLADGKAAVYSSEVPVSIEVLDHSAAKVLKRGSDWIIVQPLKEGCFPNIFKGELKWFDKTYTAYSGFNASSNDPFSVYAGYRPEITQIVLAKNHYLRGQTSRLNIKFFDNSGHFYPFESPFYSVSDSGELSSLDYNLRFILNDSSLGDLSSQGELSISSKAQLGKHEKAITLIFKFRDQEYVNTWDIYVEDTPPSYHLANMPSQMKVPPRAVFYLRDFMGYYQDQWSGYDDKGVYLIKVKQGAEALQSYEPVFRALETEGVYKKALAFSSVFGEETKEIDLVVSSQVEMDKCKGFFVGGPEEEKKEEKEAEEERDKGLSGSQRLQIPILSKYFPQVTGALQVLFSEPFYSWLFPLLSFLATLPTIFLSPWWEIRLNNLISLFSQRFYPAIPFRRREKKRGVVYDYQSKKPLSLARVQVFSYPEKRLVFQTFTNAQGEFILRLPEGNYYLHIAKRDYKPLSFVSFSSQTIYTFGRTDGYYDNIYYPEEIISIRESKGELDLSVPMVHEKSVCKVSVLRLAKEFLARYSFVFFVLGSLFSLFAFFFQPSVLWNQIVLFYYLLLWAVVVYKWVFYQPAKFVVADNKGRPLDLVLCRVLDFKGNLAGVAVSDRAGELDIQLSRGKYILKFKKPGYKSKDMPLQVHSLATLGEVKVKLEEGS